MERYALRTSIRELACVDGWNEPQFFQLRLRQALPASDAHPCIKWMDRKAASANFNQFLSKLGKSLDPLNDRNDCHLPRLPFLKNNGGYSFIYIVAIDCPQNMTVGKFRQLLQQCWNQTDWGYGRAKTLPGGRAGWEDFIATGKKSPLFFQDIDWAHYLNLT